MQYQFTPAAQRALHTAAGWTSREGCDELRAPALLLGLLAESECRAAIMLAERGIDAAAVRRRFRDLAPRQIPPGGMPPGQQRLASDVVLSLQAACQRLAGCPPPEMATEHLLLGLVAADHEVSAWLRSQGMDPDALEAEVRGLHGHRPGPLPLEPDEEPATPGTVPVSAPGTVPVSAPGTVPIFAPGTVPISAPGTVPIFAQRKWDCPLPAPRELDCPLPAPPPTPPREHVGILRVVDAAANRAREGLRVVEDYVRFVLDDRHLTGQCKQLRHDLAAALGRIPVEHRLAARETRADVGTALATPSEGRRRGAADVLAANFTRLQEALRSLEEFGKLLDPDLAAALEQLRYRAYTLHRAVEITRSSIERLDRARLCVLIDGRSSPEEFQRLAASLVEAGVHAIQLRDKTLDDHRLLQRARLLCGLARETDTLIVINDRPDLAALCRADGVHVGQDDLSVKDARTIVGPEALVGVSAHTLDQARQAQLDGANYVGVGPVFASETKQFDELAGIDLLREVAAGIRLPAFAIGGITPGNLHQVLSTGVARIAVSAAVTAAADPAAAAGRLLSILG